MKAGIVGGGIAGKLLAFRLLQKGWQVSLFEQGEDSCSMTAAGLLTPVVELEKTDKLIYSLGLRSLQILWPEILQQLTMPVFFNHRGSLVVAHPKDATELQLFMKNIAVKLPDQQPCQPLNSTQLQELEPGLSHLAGGYFLADEGNIDNQAVMQALGRYLQEHHADWQRNHTVTAVRPYEILSAQGSYKFDQVFDCRGLAAKEFFPDLRGVRGEIIFLHAPEVAISRPLRLFNSRHRIYIAPRADSHYVVGASEIESEDRSPISLRSCLELLSAAFYLHSGFAEARIIKTLSHCRPVLGNHLPQIKYKPGLMALNGLYRHGFLLAPAVLEEALKYFENPQQGSLYPQLWSMLG